ncbi:CHAT domain protein [Candidatus Magnetomorum sp. HK-1]|nr:CHAT domain protein [Candidatus Magnetomorum sp. HK-1]
MNTDSIYIEILKESDHLRIKERLPNNDIYSRFDYVYPNMQMIEERSDAIVDEINQALRHQPLQTSSLDLLKKLGLLLWDELLSARFKEIFQTANKPFLYLELDYQLLHIPWEILFDGETFLCEKFYMGRSKIITPENIIPCKKREDQKPLKMLMVSNSVKELPNAVKEGKKIRDIFDCIDQRHEYILTSQKTDLSLAELKEQLRDYDFIHYAGHAEYIKEKSSESGLKCTDGIFKASDVKKMENSAAMPLIIFSNACQSARLQAINWEHHEDPNIQNNAAGLATAFTMRGVKHYIGTYWEIQDKPGRHFSELFYNEFINNKPIGEIIHHTRKLFQKRFPKDISWISYIFYGDPKKIYTLKPGTNIILPGTGDSETDKSTNTTRAKGQNPQPQEKNRIPWETEKPRRQSNWKSIFCIMLFFICGILLWDIRQEISRSNTIAEQIKVIKPGVHTIYQQSNKMKQIPLTNQQANLVFLKKQQEGAHITLSDLNHLLTQINQLKYAWLTHPENIRIEVISIQDQLNQIIADMHLMTIRIQLKKQLDERYQRTEGLYQQYKSMVKLPPEKDHWTFGPLSLAMVFDSKMVHENESLILHAIQSQIKQEIPEIVLIERESFDKLLEELIRKGPHQSKLYQPVLLLFLATHFNENEASIISMRLDDIEKGTIIALTDDIIHSNRPILQQKQVLSQKIISILKSTLPEYPIRGRIFDIIQDKIRLNIGQKHGVAIGQQFNVVETGIVLKVKSTLPESCFCVIVSGNETIKKGLKVSMVVQPLSFKKTE